MIIYFAIRKGAGMKHFIGLDIGTSCVKAMLINKTEIVNVASFDYPVSYPHDGWSEQNPEDWFKASVSAIKHLIEGIDPYTVEAVSFSGQMHGLVTLDENDNVIRPAILWNDGRSAVETDYLNNEVGKDFLLDNTGNIAFPGFTAPKILWMNNNEKDRFDRIHKICLPKDFVAYKLSGVFATDVSDAAGTLYFDTKNRCWSKPMLDLLKINESMLPKVFESYESVGCIKKEIADALGLRDDVKIVIGAGDNAASAIGTGAINDGDCNISLGTSGTVFVLSDNYCCDRNNAIHSFCSANGKYHYLACILSAASCQKWWIEDVLNTGYDFEPLKKYIGNSRVMFLPYLMGERSPINDSKIRGAFFGLSADTAKEEMSVSVLEGVAFALRQNIDIIRSLGVNIKKSKVCGGGARNRLWLEILASVLNIELQIPVLEHGGVLGAAMLAAKSCLSSDEYGKTENEFYKTSEAISPNENLAAYYNEKYNKHLKIYPTIKNMEV